MTDISTTHGGCPTIAGEKFIVTLWIHELGNEAVFVADPPQRFSRDWARVAAKLGGDVSEQEPLLHGFVPCVEQLAAGRCLIAPLEMHRSCRHACEEHLSETQLKGRAVIDGFLPVDRAARIAKTALLAVSPGSIHSSNQSAFTSHERLAGITPTEAARWALSMPKGHKRDSAMLFVKDYIRAAEAALQAARERHGVNLSSDFIHIACRTYVGVAAPVEVERDSFTEHAGYISNAVQDLHVENLSVESAKLKCLKMQGCAGFTFEGVSGVPDVP